MIAFVRGEVAAVSVTSAVLEVGGVGLELMCTPGTLATLRLGQSATLPTSMVVREDSLTLFGFLDDDEKATFELVQTASGVGPKLAQAMLAVPRARRPAGRRRRRRRQDPHPGPGHRAEGCAADHPGAEGPARRPDRRLGPGVGAPSPRGEAQVHQGLVGLGWSSRDADQAIESVSPDAGEQPDVGALLRAALRTLSKA